MTKRKLLLICGLLAVGFGAWALYRYVYSPRYLARTNAEYQARDSGDPLPLNMESKVLFGGDTFWGRRLQAASEVSPLGERYPFSELDTFNRDSYDAWIAHLECPSTNTEVPMSDQEGPLIFNCRPGFLDEARKYFDIFSLANNHTDDVNGQAGLEETRTHLEENKFQYFGHFEPGILSDICEIVSVPVRINYDSGEIKGGLFPMAMCGYHYVFRQPKADEIETIKAFAERFVTVAVPQMGAEYVPMADSLKTKTYRGMIDAGADAVVGTHPHWIQNTEVYGGKLIAYSVGNFLFDQYWSEEVKRGVGLIMQLNAEYNDNLGKWLALGDSCQSFKDACFEQAGQQNLTKPPVLLSYDIVAADISGPTKLGSEHLLNLAKVRMNWDETLDQLKLIAPHD